MAATPADAEVAWDPLEERLQRLEFGPYECLVCTRFYNNPISADLCCDDPDQN